MDKWIEASASKMGLSVRPLEQEAASKLRSMITGRFTDDRVSHPLWERMKYSQSVHDPEAWRQVEGLKQSEVFFFFDKSDSETVYSVPPRDLVRLLADTPRYTFYVSDQEMTFLIGFNDHDYMIVAAASESDDLFTNPFSRAVSDG